MIPADNNTIRSLARPVRGWKSVAALALALTVTACGGGAEEEVPSAIGFVDIAEIDFGDDSSIWANDGECDDPRFDGPGAHPVNFDDDIRADATDCRTLFEAGEIWLK